MILLHVDDKALAEAIKKQLRPKALRMLADELINVANGINGDEQRRQEKEFSNEPAKGDVETYLAFGLARSICKEPSDELMRDSVLNSVRNIATSLKHGVEETLEQVAAMLVSDAKKSNAARR